MPSPKQIDISNSHGRNAAVVAVVAGCLAFSVCMIYVRPGTQGVNSMIQGGFGEFSAIFAVIFFAIYLVFLAIEFSKFGSVVSIGRRGIFDRRLSTGWIPWNAVRSVNVVDRGWRPGLLVHLEQSRMANLPMRRHVRRLVTRNESAPNVLWIEAENLKGGFGALRSAVTRFHKVVGSPRVE